MTMHHDKPSRTTMDSPLSWRIMPLSEVDATVAKKWELLAKKVNIPNPFVDLKFLRPAATHLPEAKGLNVLLGDDGQDLVGVLPLVHSRRLGKVPVPVGLRNRWPHVFFGHPLIAPGWEAAVAGAVAEQVTRSRSAHWLRLQHLDAESAFTQSLLGSPGGIAVHVESYERGLVVRRPDASYLQGHSNLKRLTRQRRSFESSAGTSLEVVDRSLDPDAVDEFLEMEASGWKGRTGGAFLAKESDADFLRAVCTEFRNAGDLRLWALRASGQTVAMKLNLVARDTLFCYLIAYDENYGALSPGLQLEVENFSLFHAEEDIRVMDSCAAPDNSFVNRLYPERRSLVDVSMASRRSGRLVLFLGSRLRGSH